MSCRQQEEGAGGAHSRPPQQPRRGRNCAVGTKNGASSVPARLWGPYKSREGKHPLGAALPAAPPPYPRRVTTEPTPAGTPAKLADLSARYAALEEAEATAQSKQHPRGKKTARERIEALVDEGSFVELGDRKSVV